MFLWSSRRSPSSFLFRKGERGGLSPTSLPCAEDRLATHCNAADFEYTTEVCSVRGRPHRSELKWELLCAPEMTVRRPCGILGQGTLCTIDSDPNYRLVATSLTVPRQLQLGLDSSSIDRGPRWKPQCSLISFPTSRREVGLATALRANRVAAVVLRISIFVQSRIFQPESYGNR